MLRLWCIHGNLQHASAWFFLEEAFKDDIKLEFVDLWSSEATGFWDWAELFCKELAQYPNDHHVLLGYSLGGRLALHALLEKPELFNAAIVIGADSGLTEQSERDERLKWDLAWGQRFLFEPWTDLLQSWDAQAVFAGRASSLPRAEASFTRQKIARMFDVFSKGRQDDLLTGLAKLKEPPVLYLSGEEDRRYTQVGQRLASRCPCIAHKIVASAAHRVPWENQKAFLKLLKDFLISSASNQS